MVGGVLCALGAGMMWGLVFIAPLLLHDYPGIVLSFGRFIAFGLIAIVPAWLQRRRLARLTRADWRVALKLTCIGNLLYYAALASAIQYAGAPVPTILIGTLPVTIALYSNWTYRKEADAIAWGKLAPSLLAIFAGLIFVNMGELAQVGQVERSTTQYVLGTVLALAAVAMWTWYPVVNARHLREHPHVDPAAWVTAQGLATLPLALAGYAIFGAVGKDGFDFPLGPRPAVFVGLMLLVGITASWLANVLWNMASKRLPTSLAGQLIVFETLFALLYAFSLRQEWPGGAVAAGIAFLLFGVWLGMRAFRQP